MIHTPRLRLVPSTVELATVELEDRAAFARLLDARVPAEWPPASAADALPFFLSLLRERPDWSGWLGWYAITTDGEPTLVAGGGFKGPANENREVETGYSVLPQFYRRGYATEMVGGLIEWAFASGTVDAVLAQTTGDNLGSRGVLAKLGFVPIGPGEEPGGTMYRLTRT